MGWGGRDGIAELDRAVREESGITFHARPAKKRIAAADRPRADSPFAKLAALTFAR